MNATEWLERYAAALGAQAPTAEEFRAVLDLAAEAAHASERVAAPVACWLSARAGVPLERALELAKQVNDDELTGSRAARRRARGRPAR